MNYESSHKLTSIGLGLSLAFGSLTLSACNHSNEQETILKANRYVPEKCSKIYPNNLVFTQNTDQAIYDEVSAIDKQISESVCNVANMVSKDTYKLINHHNKNVKFDVSSDGSTIDIMMTDSSTGAYTDTEYWVTKDGQPKFNHIQGLMIGNSRNGKEGAINIDLLPNSKGTDWTISSTGNYANAKLPKYDSSDVLVNPTIDQMKLNQLSAYILSVEMITHNK